MLSIKNVNGSICYRYEEVQKTQLQDIPILVPIAKKKLERWYERNKDTVDSLVDQYLDACSAFTHEEYRVKFDQIRLRSKLINWIRSCSDGDSC